MVSPNLTLADLVIQEAQNRGVPPALALAMVHVESNWNPNAVSGKNAQGLFQIIPSTLADMARVLGRVLNPFNPTDSVQAGILYISQQLRAFGDVRLALAAYNAGPGAVQKYKGIPPFMETQNYVKKILALVPEYEVWLGVRGGQVAVPSDFKTEKPERDREAGVLATAGILVGITAGALLALIFFGD